MKKKLNSETQLKLLLWFVMFHSFANGVGLIIQIPAVMHFFGFSGCHEHFFPAQGGTFHVVMAIGYGMAAWDPNKYRCLIIFSIIVKLCAMVFLLTYYFFCESIWTLLFSGIVDGLMGIFLFYFYKKYMTDIEQA